MRVVKIKNLKELEKVAIYDDDNDLVLPNDNSSVFVADKSEINMRKFFGKIITLKKNSASFNTPLKWRHEGWIFEDWMIEKEYTPEENPEYFL